MSCEFNTNYCYSTLPVAVESHIYSFLDARGLCALAAVNKHTNAVSSKTLSDTDFWITRVLRANNLMHLLVQAPHLRRLPFKEKYLRAKYEAQGIFMGRNVKRAFLINDLIVTSFFVAHFLNPDNFIENADQLLEFRAGKLIEVTMVTASPPALATLLISIFKRSAFHGGGLRAPKWYALGALCLLTCGSRATIEGNFTEGALALIGGTGFLLRAISTPPMRRKACFKITMAARSVLSRIISVPGRLWDWIGNEMALYDG